MTRTERLVYRLLMTAGVLSLLVFYGWWLRPQNLPDNLDGPGQLVDVAIFAALTGVLSHRIFMDVYVWVVARKIRPLTEPPEPEAGLRVAFITTFVPGSEGLDLLARTLPAMVAVDYPHDTWLLDEGADEDARMLCERLGVRYFTRRGVSDYNEPAGPFTARTKGGNHNAWHDTHGEDYDIVAQIDTDFPPHPDYLNRTLGHFRDPEVGWVISPQIYGNTDTLITRGAAEQQYTFYGPVLRGLAGRGLASMLGANHVVRTAALHDIGLYAGHITEDLLTGMRLHAAGWRSEYVPEVLAVGEGPDTWRAYFSQQRRWAFGCMHVLRKHSTDLLPRMSWTGRSLYLSLMQGYFTGLVGAVGSLLLLAYFVGGVEISRLSLVELLIYGTPLFLMRQVIRLWLQRFSVRPEVERGLMLSGGLVAIAAWPVYFDALLRVLRNGTMRFSVTPKGRVSKGTSGSRSLFLPHLSWALASAICLVCIPLYDRDSAVLTAWAALNVLTLGCLFAFADLRLGLRGQRVLDASDNPAQGLVLLTAGAAAGAHSLVDAHVVDQVVLRKDGVG